MASPLVEEPPESDETVSPLVEEAPESDETVRITSADDEQLLNSIQVDISNGLFDTASVTFVIMMDRLLSSAGGQTVQLARIFQTNCSTVRRLASFANTVASSTIGSTHPGQLVNVQDSLMELGTDTPEMKRPVSLMDMGRATQSQRVLSMEVEQERSLTARMEVDSTQRNVYQISVASSREVSSDMEAISIPMPGQISHPARVDVSQMSIDQQGSHFDLPSYQSPAESPVILSPTRPTEGELFLDLSEFSTGHGPSKSLPEELVERLPTTPVHNVSISVVNKMTSRIGPTIKKFIQMKGLANERGIVHCLERKECDTIANSLRVLGVKAESFYEEKHKLLDILEKWRSAEEIHILVAVSDFIRLDASVDGYSRFMIHALCPTSLEKFYDEIRELQNERFPNWVDCLVLTVLFNYNDVVGLLFKIESAVIVGSWTISSKVFMEKNLALEAARVLSGKIDCGILVICKEFGVDAQRCGACLNCLYGENFEKTDVTAESVAIIDAIRILNEKYVPTHKAGFTVNDVEQIVSGRAASSLKYNISHLEKTDLYSKIWKLFEPTHPRLNDIKTMLHNLIYHQYVEVKIHKDVKWSSTFAYLSVGKPLDVEVVWIELEKVNLQTSTSAGTAQPDISAGTAQTVPSTTNNPEVVSFSKKEINVPVSLVAQLPSRKRSRVSDSEPQVLTETSHRVVQPPILGRGVGPNLPKVVKRRKAAVFEANSQAEDNSRKQNSLD